jgi:HlyD family secretion protein
MEISTKPKSASKILIILPILLLGTIGGFILWRSIFPPTQPQVENIAQKILTVTALGYLEPQGKIIKLNAPSSSGGNSRVDQLRVNIGDAVKKSQIIAVLDSRDRLAASLRESEEQVKIAEADLEVVKAGAKQGEIESQRATIERLQAQRQGDLDVQTATINRLKAEVENAQVESQRYQSLYQEGATK